VVAPRGANKVLALCLPEFVSIVAEWWRGACGHEAAVGTATGASRRCSRWRLPWPRHLLAPSLQRLGPERRVQSHIRFTWAAPDVTLHRQKSYSLFFCRRFSWRGQRFRIWPVATGRSHCTASIAAGFGSRNRTVWHLRDANRPCSDASPVHLCTGLFRLKNKLIGICFSGPRSSSGFVAEWNLLRVPSQPTARCGAQVDNRC
jgi:hypothetical protein